MTLLAGRTYFASRTGPHREQTEAHQENRNLLLSDTVVCPTGVLDMSERINKHGYHPPKVVKLGACHGCRLCELICPEFAIFIENE